MAGLRIHHINTLTMCPISARLVNGKGGPFERGRLVCHCLVVESDDGLILVDTGIGTDDIRDVGRLGFPFGHFAGPKCDPTEPALARIKALGFDPRDVRHIVPTHLDVDHAGGLPDFPEATVHIYREEHEAALRPQSALERMRYHAVHFAHGPKWKTHEVEGDTWLGLQAIKAIDHQGDVLLVPLLGHTRGHCGVAVRTETGWLLHAGDAYFHHSEIREGRGSCPVGLAAFQRFIAANNTLRLQSLATIKALHNDHKDLEITSAHCPTEFDSYAAA